MSSPHETNDLSIAHVEIHFHTGQSIHLSYPSQQTSNFPSKITNPAISNHKIESIDVHHNCSCCNDRHFPKTCAEYKNFLQLTPNNNNNINSIHDPTSFQSAPPTSTFAVAHLDDSESPPAYSSQYPANTSSSSSTLSSTSFHLPIPEDVPKSDLIFTGSSNCQGMKQKFNTFAHQNLIEFYTPNESSYFSIYIDPHTKQSCEFILTSYRSPLDELVWTCYFVKGNQLAFSQIYDIFVDGFSNKSLADVPLDQISYNGPHFQPFSLTPTPFQVATLNVLQIYSSEKEKEKNGFNNDLQLPSSFLTSTPSYVDQLCVELRTLTQILSLTDLSLLVQDNSHQDEINPFFKLISLLILPLTFSSGEIDQNVNDDDNYHLYPFLMFFLNSPHLGVRVSFLQFFLEIFASFRTALLDPDCKVISIILNMTKPNEHEHECGFDKAHCRKIKILLQFIVELVAESQLPSL